MTPYVIKQNKTVNPTSESASSTKLQQKTLELYKNPLSPQITSGEQAGNI